MVWSPTDSQDHLIGLINGATSSLRIYSEEMGDRTIENALIRAAKRGTDTKHGKIFIGSENFSNASLNQNRELGLIISSHVRDRGHVRHGFPERQALVLGVGFLIMTVNLVRSGSLYPGVPYAYASVAPRGSLIFTAGACPLDDRGEVVGAGDVRAQASLAVANLATALAESGATLADVLKTTVFVASAERADLVAAWDVVGAAFGEHDAPSTLLGVAVLGYQDQLVEIEAVAVAPG